MRRVLAVLAILVLSACGRESAPSRSPHREVGETSMLVVDSTREQGVTAVKTINLLDPEWQTPDLEYTLPAGARVRILAVDPRGAHVEVLDGAAQGSRGWVRWESVR